MYVATSILKPRDRRETVSPAPQREDPDVTGYVCYMYSEDRMTNWHDVLGHAPEAREKGWKSMRCFLRVRVTARTCHMILCTKARDSAVCKVESKL
ncbi:hypothetical protein IFM47457_11133 [Aspergillus lentulus]|nr:hypothetical protein IFM47457_11133 [Aspergillus lentulus]